MEAAEVEIETSTEESPELEIENQAAGEDQPGAEESPELEGEDGNEVEVSIGGEPDPQAEEERKAPQWVRDLRRQTREKDRRIKELEAKLSAPAAETKPVQLGPKPKIEAYDYDAEKFEAALTQWYETKRRADEEERQRQAEAKAQDDAWKATLGSYEKAKTELKVSDFQEAELEAQHDLSVVQQGIVVQGAKNPALVIYAIGKNPAKRKELAAITDPVKFAFAVANLEAQLKVTPKKPTTEPERTVSGTGRVSGAVDSQMDRLREEARRTGDYTKVIAYKNQLAQKKG